MKNFKIKVVKENNSYTSYVLKHDEVVFSSANNQTSIIAARKAGEYISEVNNMIVPATAKEEILEPTLSPPTVPVAKQTTSIDYNQAKQFSSFTRKCCGRG
jgi:hypothetical protein